MACPFLIETHNPACTVGGGRYFSSLVELEQYCRNEQGKVCSYPTLLLFGMRHSVFPEDHKQIRAEKEVRDGFLLSGVCSACAGHSVLRHKNHDKEIKKKGNISDRKRRSQKGGGLN